MGRKRLAKTAKRRPLNVTVDPDEREWAQKRAKEMKETVSHYIRTLIRKDRQEALPQP